MSVRLKERLPTFCAIAVLALVGVFALRQASPPPLPIESASPNDFSVTRALEHVRRIAREPHPNGSGTNAEVRRYLVDELRKFGAEPEVTESRVRRYRDGSVRTVHNIIARFKGSGVGGTEAVMLAAHYDSAPQAPGAADDGAAVAAILEAMRVLRDGPPLQRDVIILLTDGEEMGLLGARAFCGEGEDEASQKPHRYLKDVVAVLNFEARGTAGASVMFETSPGNVRLVRHFAAGAPWPVGSSLGYDVYKLLPNDTDFTVFKRHGIRGLNFAFIGNYVYYHTSRDDVAHLDPRSMYHHGSAALGLTRRLANLHQREVEELKNVGYGLEDAVFFNLWRGKLVVYSARWIWPLVILQSGVCIAAVWLGYRRGAIRGLGWAFLRFGAALVLAPLAMYGLTLWTADPRSAEGFDWQVARIVWFAVIITLVLALEFRGRITLAALGAAGLIVWGMLGIVAAVWLPGGSYLVTWPAIFAALAFCGRVGMGGSRWLMAGLAVAGGAGVMLLVPPITYLTFTAMRLPLAWAVCGMVVLGLWLLLAVFAGPRSGERE